MSETDYINSIPGLKESLLYLQDHPEAFSDEEVDWGEDEDDV